MYKYILILMTYSKVKTFDIATTPSPYPYPNFTELVEAIGYKSETHETISEDGYILTLFNIPGNKSRPVFIMHGMLNSADILVLRGKESLGYALANEGYDLWFGNYRGNRYNRRHITYDPIEEEFWNFTFHEMGYYDLPANIDYILNATGQTKLSAVGYSQGTTMFFVLGSTKPEYNEKINVFISLAPIVYFKHVEPPFSTLMDMERLSSQITKNNQEIFVKNYKDIFLSMCRRPSGNKACKKIFTFGGTVGELDQDFILQYIFAGSMSRKLAQHLAQLRKTFAQYDYGSTQNVQVYNSTQPPEYNLGYCSMNTALFLGKNDKLSVVKDVDMLRDKLPNVVEYKMLDPETFGHTDFVWGKNLDEYLFPYILDILEKYS